MQVSESQAVKEPSRRVGGKLFRSTGLVALFTMISRLLGFVRDVIFASMFGAGPEFDAFVIAFKFPNFMRRLFAEGAFSQAFVPILAEYKEKRSPEEVRAFVNHIAGTLAAVLILVVAIVEIAAPLVIMVFAPGFADHGLRQQLATHMLRIMFPYLILIALTAFCGAILNTFGRFGSPAFAPVLLNIALISVAVWWAPHTSTPIYTLAWGVLLGGLLQLILQWPFLRRLRIFPIPKPRFKDPGVMRVLKLMIPALFGVSVAQISMLIDNFFASFLPQGSISWLYYSDRLTYLPLGVIGVALATVVMPYLSRMHSQNSQEDFSKTLDWALRLNILAGVPSAVGLFILSGPLLATLFRHGVFNDYDVYMTRESLMAFAVGLPAFMLVKVLASAFYSRQNIRTPVKIAAIAMVTNLVLNLALIVPLKHAGLALATSLASWLNSILLIVMLFRHKIYQAQTRWSLLILRVFIANLCMGVFIWWAAGNLQHWLHWVIWTQVWHLFGTIFAGIVIYAIVLFATGIRLRDLKPPQVET